MSFQFVNPLRGYLTLSTPECLSEDIEINLMIALQAD